MINVGSEKEFYSINEISRILGVSWKTVFSTIKKARIKTIKTKKETLVPRSYLSRIKRYFSAERNIKRKGGKAK